MTGAPCLLSLYVDTLQTLAATIKGEGEKRLSGRGEVEKCLKGRSQGEMSRRKVGEVGEVKGRSQGEMSRGKVEKCLQGSVSAHILQCHDCHHNPCNATTIHGEEQNMQPSKHTSQSLGAYHFQFTGGTKHAAQQIPHHRV